MILSAENDTTTGLLVEQKTTEIVLFRKGEFLRVETDKVKLLNFLRKGGRHELKTINLLQVDCDSLNQYMKQPVVKVTAQSKQELYYFEGPIMKKGNELSADYPNGARFQQLAIDNSETEAQLQLLTASYKAQKRKYAAEVAKITALRAELVHEQNRTATHDYDEGERRMRVKVLAEQVSQIVTPESPDQAVYGVQKSLLEMKLKETAHLNATILIWQAQSGQN